MLQITLPESDEYAPYFATYVRAARERLESGVGTLKGLLERQPDELELLPGILRPEKAGYSYSSGKWTLLESVIHMADTERVFAYRLLRIARGDKLPLAGFDQDAWVPETRASTRTMQSALAEFRAVRGATIPLIASLDETALARRGTASDQSITVRALVWIIAGHAQHHIQVAKERYLTSDTGR